MSLDVDALRTSFQVALERQPQLTHRFYEILFTRYPQARPLFGRTHSVEAQEKMLAEALVAVLDHLEDGAWLTTQLREMGRRHHGYGITREMYPWVGECLVAALKEAAGDGWSPRAEAAWGGAYGAICDLMFTGYPS